MLQSVARSADEIAENISGQRAERDSARSLGHGGHGSNSREELKSMVAKAEAECKSDLGGFDPGLQITVEKIVRPEKVFDAADARARWLCWSPCRMACWP